MCEKILIFVIFRCIFPIWKTLNPLWHKDYRIFHNCNILESKDNGLSYRFLSISKKSDSYSY